MPQKAKKPSKAKSEKPKKETAAQPKPKAEKKSGLGRNLDTLIPTQLVRAEFDPSEDADKQMSRAQNMLIQDIKPNPDQPRRHFEQDALNELMASIEAHGVLQPIVVAEADDGHIIIAGERRWRAAQMAGLEVVPVMVRTSDNQEQLEIALIENLQREDLNPIEAATGFLKLVDQFSFTPDRIADRIGRNITTVRNTMRLLGLPSEAQDAIIEGRITEGHGRAVLSLNGHPEKQAELLKLIQEHNWSVRKAEQFATAYKSGADTARTAIQRTKNETPETKQVAKQLDTKVWVHNMAKGGRLIIEYKDSDDFDRITGRLLTP